MGPNTGRLAGGRPTKLKKIEAGSKRKKKGFFVFLGPKGLMVLFPTLPRTR